MFAVGPTKSYGCSSFVDGLLFTALDNELILSLAYSGTLRPFATPGPPVKLKGVPLLLSEFGEKVSLSLLVFLFDPFPAALAP